MLDPAGLDAELSTRRPALVAIIRERELENPLVNYARRQHVPVVKTRKNGGPLTRLVEKAVPSGPSDIASRPDHGAYGAKGRG